MDVGVRELRNHLSRYLDRVRDGEDVVVTERGRPIARITSLSSTGRLDRLIAEGVVTPGRAPRRIAPPVPTAGPVSDLVGEERR